MSELYSVAIEAASTKTGEVVMRVTTVHPDAGPPPNKPTFPMNLLTDLWILYERGYTALIQGHPKMSDDAALDHAMTEPWGPVFKRLRELSRGLEQPITKAE